MNGRLTVAAAVATVLASIALYPLLHGGMWFWGGVGAVIVVAVVGAATRRRAIPAVLCFLAAIGAYKGSATPPADTGLAWIRA